MNQYEQITAYLDRKLRPGDNFDILRRTLTFGQGNGKKATFYFIDGFVKDELTTRLFEYVLGAENVQELYRNFPYVEVEETTDRDKMVTAVLSGCTVMCAEGYDSALLVDTRQYPVRSVAEPDNDKVLRGSRDGFTETMISNLVLIRRRIRDARLTVHHHAVGRETRTDVALCYVEGMADKKLLAALEKKLSALQVDGLNLAQESLAECLITSHWYNPFPKIRYTERPDVAAASLLEGSVLVVCDNSPQVMLLPTSIFDFLQESDDFYFPPCVGTYLRVLRLAIFLLTLTLTPTWYLLMRHTEWIPSWLNMIKLTSECQVPLLAQLLLVEFTIDGLKMASMNTPSTLNNSLSVVGGLILGDFAVDMGWLVPEVIVFMAFVAIANFTQASYELGYAFKFLRMIWLILIGIFDVWGYIGGGILVLLAIATNKTVEGSRSYLYPFIPFNARALGRLLTRQPLRPNQP